MRRATLGLAAAMAAGLVHQSAAVVQPKGGDDPYVAADRGPRAQRTVELGHAGELAPHGLGDWTAMWDRDTGVPLRLWGAGIAAPNVLADAAVAETVARRFLAEHLALLAPGAVVGDFTLVSNELGGAGNTRSVGFVQHARGIAVLGGAIGFTFKHDHLVMVSSTALPDVRTPTLATRIGATELGRRAVAWLGTGGETVTARGASDLVVLPIVRHAIGGRRDITYRLAEQVAVDAVASPGRWDVWIDAVDGRPIARRSAIHFASGKVMYDVPDRGPAGMRHPQPSSLANHTVNGATVAAALDGTVTWASGTATIAPKLTGSRVAVTSSSGSTATGSLTLADASSVTWSQATSETADAQLASYVFANQAKQFAKVHYNPNLAYIEQRLSVNVNENDTCNAYSTNDDIHFYRKGGQCENTGRISDVVYHEFGHSLHAHSIIAGVGQMDGALSEGLADINAANILGDHCMGKGFFVANDACLRDLDPIGKEKTWQNDTTGEVHDDGEIIGEALWDMRVALETKLGQQAGYLKSLEIYYGVMQRSSDIPSSYAEALVADDDDGNVANGTPNACEINGAFKLHGLATGTVTAPVPAPVRDHYSVTLTTQDPSTAACTLPAISNVVLDWRPRGGTGGQIAMAKTGTTYAGDIPAHPDGTVVEYRVLVTLAGNTTTAFPANAADPYYQFYVGPVTPLWCASFEQGAGDWTHGATPAAADEWEAGAPLGLTGDPRAAHGGNAVFGIDLTRDGAYTKSATSFAETPAIDLVGHTNVRLQYYRWLGVEDGFYDHARIQANGTEVWSNLASPSIPQSPINHLDREWRFQDVDLSAQAASGTLKLRFELQADQGSQFGGWTMDDVCVVYEGVAPGDGTGGGGDDDGTGGTGGGCCSTGTGPASALALSALTLGLMLRRRRTVSIDTE